MQSPDFNIFIGGDSGYDTFFTEIGEKYGPIDLAILEQGQYGKNWNLIHMLPEQLMQTVQDLQAQRVLPVHNSRFTLANHEWDEPMKMATENSTNSNISVLTPQMGEVVFMKDTTQTFSKWWENLK